MNVKTSAGARPVNADAVAAEIRRLLPEVAAGAPERERERRLPFEEHAALVRAGLGAFRLAEGGSIEALAGLLVEVGAADSNIVQAFRGHLGFVEFLLLHPERDRADVWLDAARQGATFGPAASEIGNASPLSLKTRLSDEEPRTVSGAKYYTTGSLFSSHINVLALGEDEEFVEAVVRADAPGVSVDDDWAGFGQRLSASGTARFAAAPVEADGILPHRGVADGLVSAFYQLVHSANIAGIIRRSVSDIGVYVRGRTRRYPNATAETPAGDPQVLQVIGEVEAAAFIARAGVLAAGHALDTAATALRGGAELTEESTELLRQAEVASAALQVSLTDLAPRVLWQVYETGGASAVAAELALDRHLRNARVLSSHNPAIYKARQIGNVLVNDRPFSESVLGL